MRWKDSNPTYVNWGCRLPPSISPDHVSDLLGLPPTHMRRIGETTDYYLDPESRKTVRSHPFPCSVWNYSSLSISQSPVLADHIDILLKLFEERKPQLDQLHSLGAQSGYRLWADNTTSFDLDLTLLPRLLATTNDHAIALCVFSPDDSPDAGSEAFFRYRYELTRQTHESPSVISFFESTGTGAVTDTTEETHDAEERFMASFVANVAALRDTITPRLSDECHGAFSFSWQRDYMSFVLSEEMIGQMLSVADQAAFSLFA